MSLALTIAPHFHLGGAWADRLLVREGADWRVPQESELAELIYEPTTHEELQRGVCLFSIPAHLRSAFWEMLARQASHEDGDFVSFAAEVSEFLKFKQMSLPDGATCELVLRGASGTFDSTGLWGVVNLADEPALIDWPLVRLRLGPGEGCRVGPGMVPEVPTATGEPYLLLVIRG